MPLEIFKAEFTTNFESVLTSGIDTISSMRDYKQGPYTMPIFTQYNLKHEPFSYRIAEEHLPDGTAITTIPSVILSNNNLYTGDHHNHFIPRYDIVYDIDGEVETSLQDFHKILKRRVQYEKQMRPDQAAKYEVVNVQDRRSILSPYILQQARRHFT